MPEQQNQPPKGQTYVVKTDFTDDKGRKWTVGTTFTGDGEAVAKALKAGRIEARPQPEPQPEPQT